jgi:hypothetical protein
MNNKTIDWIKVMVSIVIFNLIIIGFLAYFSIASGYTLTLKIVLDISIGFVTDKSIKRLSVNWKDGFIVSRD